MAEAGMSGCIIFWHDAMNLGNRFETVFEISIDPVEISQKDRGKCSFSGYSALKNKIRDFYTPAHKRKGTYVR